MLVELGLALAFELELELGLAARWAASEAEVWDDDGAADDEPDDAEGDAEGDADGDAEGEPDLVAEPDEEGDTGLLVGA